MVGFEASTHVFGLSTVDVQSNGGRRFLQPLQNFLGLLDAVREKGEIVGLISVGYFSGQVPPAP